MGYRREIVNSSRGEVVNDIAKGTAAYIATRAIEESPSIEDAVEVMQDVVRHLMKKLSAERRRRKRRKK